MHIGATLSFVYGILAGKYNDPLEYSTSVYHMIINSGQTTTC